jgi:16S rRNA pseudouridine516 synthase
MRIDRYISKFEGLSRNYSRSLIKSGKVSVDGRIVRDPSFHVEENASVTLDGSRVVVFGMIYIMMNKPAGYVCSRDESEGPTVFDLVLERFSYDLSVAGRLDRDTTGLTLLSNDGQFVHHVISPKKTIEKEYLVQTMKPVTPEQIEAMSGGLFIGRGEFSKPVRVRVLGESSVEIILTEGRFHEVKRLVKASGNEVLSLHRSRIGGLSLPEFLKPGEWINIGENALKRITGAE